MFLIDRCFQGVPSTSYDSHNVATCIEQSTLSPVVSYSADTDNHVQQTPISVNNVFDVDSIPMMSTCHRFVCCFPSF
jgi:hypothetical protein